MPVVLGFAAVAAWGDIRPMVPYLFGKAEYHGVLHGRIPNRLVLAWLACGAVLVLGGVAWRWAGAPFPAADWVEHTEGLLYPVAVVVNAVLAFVLGFTLWTVGLWAAGDAKVFALLAFTLPLSSYQDHYLSYFPSFTLFFNTFIAVFLLLLVEFVARTVLVIGQTKGGFLREKASWIWNVAKTNRIGILKLVVFFLALFTIIRILRHLVRGGIDQFMEMNKTIVYLILFLLFAPLKRLAEKKVAVVVGLLVVGGYALYAFVFDPTGEAKHEFLNIGWLAVSIIVFRAVYDAYLKATDEVEIPVGELKPGMILAESTLKKFKERKQFFAEKLSDLSPDGIDASQMQSLAEWYGANEPGGTIFVSRTIPFAPALLLGAILTLLSGGLVLVF